MAFTLHDTHGFPVELTEELARDAGVEVDRAGFDAAMAAQRERARAAAKSSRAGDEAVYRALLESDGTTTFVGRGQENYEVPARVVAVLEVGADADADEASGPTRARRAGSAPKRVAAAASSRSSWTAPPSTPRAAARWGTPAPS